MVAIHKGCAAALALLALAFPVLVSWSHRSLQEFLQHKLGLEGPEDGTPLAATQPRFSATNRVAKEIQASGAVQVTELTNSSSYLETDDSNGRYEETDDFEGSYEETDDSKGSYEETDDFKGIYEEIQASSAVKAIAQTSSSKEGLVEVVSKVSYAFAHGMSSSLTKMLGNSNLPNLSSFKFECIPWDLQENASSHVKTEFKDVTGIAKITAKDARAKGIFPDSVEYKAYAYPEGGDLGYFLYYDEHKKLSWVVKLVGVKVLADVHGRNDFQFDLKAISKDPPDCELKDFNLGFQNVKRFCYSPRCRKKNGKKIGIIATYCFVFEKKDGEYWMFHRNFEVMKSTWNKWRHKGEGYRGLATSKSIVVSIAVALSVLFSD